MSDSTPLRNKRNGARLFKNPPQPHMCIQDCIAGTTTACYVNVLSWDKVNMPKSSLEPIPLYGGMRISPPRSEKQNVFVFAVIANPQILFHRGKNAENLEEQSSFIEVLLDFVETMNKDIVFDRKYVILKDRDITGELKEVWMSVQNNRDRESTSNQQEVWIDAQPQQQQQQQYSLNVEQQQNQQQYQLHQPQSYQTSQQPPQQQQSYYPQQQQIMPNTYLPQPPQYQSNLAYEHNTSNYERYNSDLHNDHNRRTRSHNFEPKQYQTPTMKYSRPELQQNCPNYSISQYYERMEYDFQQFVGQPHIKNHLQTELFKMQQNVLPQAPRYTNYSRNKPLRKIRPHKNNNVNNKQNNSSPSSYGGYLSQTGEEIVDVTDHSKSPTRILQREPSANKQNNLNSKSLEKTLLENIDNYNADEASSDDPGVNTGENSSSSSNQSDWNNYLFNYLLYKKDRAEKVILPAETEGETMESEEFFGDQAPVKIISKKDNIEVFNKGSSLNGIRTNFKLSNSTGDLFKNVPTTTDLDIQNATLNAGKNQFLKHKVSDGSRRSQSTVNSIIKSVFKIHQGNNNSSNEAKSNGQIQNAKHTNNEQQDAFQGYTILKKSDTAINTLNDEDLTNNIAQISITDCKETTEINALIS